MHIRKWNGKIIQQRSKYLELKEDSIREATE